MSENGTQERRPRHTGNGGARARPRGRRADPGDLDALRQLLSDPPYRRDLLIEYLHAIQDHDRCIRPSQLAALAELVGLSQTEVYEVATFYAHFDVVDQHEPAPPPLT
ncbi:MAG: NAD(P)H-dependent oxidoreductase subunit E, partial [Chromatiales bacterium]|nr:NAD(P)H-dependent oxidoreductase subunit E [Chromatiales bacterium]